MDNANVEWLPVTWNAHTQRFCQEQAITIICGSNVDVFPTFPPRWSQVMEPITVLKEPLRQLS
jgi:hypothetical protein